MSAQSIIEFAVLMIGLCVIVFSQWLGRSAVEVQHKYFGFVSEKNEIRDSIFATATIGAIFVIAALFSMLKITSFRL